MFQLKKYVELPKQVVDEIVKNPVVKVEENMDTALSRLSSMSERESVAQPNQTMCFIKIKSLFGSETSL